MRLIALIGLPGSGKTSVGRRLAGELGLSFVDLDDQIERESAMTVSEIFDLEGEAGFRRRESQSLLGVIATAPPEGLILACGGGVVLDADNVALLKASYEVIYLRVEPEVAEARIVGKGGRPLLNGSTVSNLLVQRSSLYEQSASVVVDGCAPVQDVVELILAG